jgi:subtilisin family serine protease
VNASRRVLALIATAALAASITVSTGAAQANTKAGTNTATETGPPTDSKVLDLPITASGSLAGSVAQNLLARQPNLVRNPYSLLIEFAAGADPESVLGLLKETNTRLVQQFSETNVYQLETTGDLGTIRSLLARDDQVLWVDFDNIVSATATKEPSPAPDVSIQLSNDSMASQLWGLFGSNGIRAEAAWAATASVQDVVIAVIDSGVMIEHPDLAANIWTNPGEIAGNGIDDDNNGFVDDLHGWDFVDGDNQPNDLAGHGTHVAGTIAAVRDNGIGVAGVAHNAKIMPIRFLDANGQGFVSDALSGLDYALRNGAKVSNNSWGGGAPSSAFSATLDRANSEGHLVCGLSRKRIDRHR